MPKLPCERCIQEARLQLNPATNRDFSSHSIPPTISSSYLHHTTLSSAISMILSLSTLHNRPDFPVCLFNNLFCPPPVLPFSAATPPPYVPASVPPLPCGKFRPYHVKEPDGCLPRSAHFPIIFLDLFIRAAGNPLSEKKTNKKTFTQVTACLALAE